MARRKVFICYSHQDQELFDELLIHLDPLTRVKPDNDQTQLEIWTDKKIPAGREWEPEIYRRIDEADAGVVLVSPELLASDFVSKKELPRLLAARAERALRLTPLYLRESVARHLTFEVETANGPYQINLTDIQGLNDPKLPLAKLSRAERDEIWAQVPPRLLTAEESGSERQIRPQQHEIVVLLELREGIVARRYGRFPHVDLFANSDPIDLPRLEALNASRSRADDEPLGQELFEVLFGGESKRHRILSGAMGQEIHDPLRPAFRVLIHADDERLRAMPWACCRWRRYVLAEEGWTFELAPSLEPKPVERLQMPCRAVLVTAQPEGHEPLKTQAHENSLETILARSWKQPRKKTCWQRVSTLTELKEQLADPPRLLHLYCHARQGSKELELILETASGRAETVRFSTLAKLLARHPPQILVLSTVGESPLMPAVPGVSMALHLRHPDAGAASRSLAQEWWVEVAGHGTDPVVAFHELGEDARRIGAVLTGYESWEASLSDYVPKVDRARSRLDRRRQRQAVWGAVRELVDNPRRKVTCLVAYGGNGNLVDHFSAQMVDTLHDWAQDSARLEKYNLTMPAEREDLTAACIDAHFRDLMELTPLVPLHAAFDRRRRGGPSAKPVFFLDWNTYGDGHLPALHSGHLEGWLTFCCGHLERACPPGARILSYIALVSAEERHGELNEVLQELKDEPAFRQPHFRLVPVPALGKVSASDLLDFMENRDNCSCPEGYLHNLPDRIVQHTEGDFKATVTLLEDAERRNTWHELYAELPEAPRKPRRRKDVPL